MKKAKLLVAAAALSLASAASADQVGGYLFGLQYQQDNGLRYGVGLPFVGLFSGGGALALSGDVSYLLPLNSGSAGFDPYYGFGLGVAITLGSGSGTSAGALSLYPNALIGGNFDTGTRWTPFVEGSVGPNIYFAHASSGGSSASGAGIGIGFGVRLGVNYRLN